MERMISELQGPPGKITSALITMICNDTRPSRVVLIEVINLCHLALRLNKNFKLDYIYKLTEIHGLIQHAYKLKPTPQFIEQLFEKYAQTSNSNDEKLLCQPQIQTDSCTYMSLRSNQILWESEDPAKIVDCLLYNQYKVCQISDGLVISIFLKRNRLDLLLNDKIFAYVNPIRYCVDDAEKVDLSIFRTYFNSIKAEVCECQLSQLLIKMYGDDISRILDGLDSVFGRNEDGDLPLLTKTINKKIFGHICNQKFSSDYLGYGKSDKDDRITVAQKIYQQYMTQMSERFASITRIQRLTKNYNFCGLQSLMQKLCCVNNLVVRLPQEQRKQFIGRVIEGLGLRTVARESLVLLQFCNIRNTLFWSQMVDLDDKETLLYYAAYALDCLDTADIQQLLTQGKLQLVQLVMALPLVVQPLIGSAKINLISSDIEQLNEIVEEASRYQYNDHLCALNHLYSAYLPEVTMRMNWQNIQMYLNSICMFSDTFAIQHCHWMIQQITQTDLSDIMFQILSTNSELTVKLTICALLGIINKCTEMSRQLSNGVLNKLYQQLVVFTLTVIFQLDEQFNGSMVAFFFRYILCRCRDGIQTHQSCLHLFMLRELLAHVFCRCSGFCKERKRLVDAVQLQRNAFEQFEKTSDGQALAGYLRIMLDDGAIQPLYTDILTSLSPNGFMRPLLTPGINYEELTELITLAQDDLLFLVGAATLEQDLADRLELEAAALPQTDGILLYRMLLRSKTGKPTNELERLQADMEPWRIFHLIIIGPRACFNPNESFMSWLASPSTLYRFMHYSYVAAISLTRDGVDRLGILLSELFKMSGCGAGPLLYHGHLTTYIFEATHSDRAVELHYIIQAHYAEDHDIMQAVSAVLCSLARGLDKEDQTVLLRTTLLRLGRKTAELNHAALTAAIKRVAAELPSSDAIHAVVDVGQAAERLAGALGG